jgi:cellulose synthase (UDP-forming)
MRVSTRTVAPAAVREHGHLVSLHSTRQRVQLGLLVTAWLIALLRFWVWWLDPEHQVGPLRHAINSLALFWTTIIPGYFVFFLWRARVPDPVRPVPTQYRVAMVVTKAPSEPFAVVQRTLLAMLEQDTPHDTWLADEDPSAETTAWCERHHVRISTRRGRADYHRATWPRRTRCKEGNLAYFYDTHGYDEYDVVVQMDADHVPTPGYLREILRPFADPAVGYVSAPSICDGNAATSWWARGRLYVEGALHGALQAGHNGGAAPLCIGSHYAVRTRALRDIGGLGPELAEDHSTTLMMNAHGWRGVHALHAIAHGDGPRTFADLVTQEFQWSRSLVLILLRYTRRYIGGLSWPLRGQFLFAQLWYPLFALMMLLMFLMPIAALITGSTWANVIYAEFFLYGGLVDVAIMLIMLWVRAQGWMRPAGSKVVSWEGTLFLFARWPWALLGTCAAILTWLRGRESAFRVTPKGEKAGAPLPVRVVAPYALLSLASAAAAIVLTHVGNASGFYVFAIANSLLYSLILVTVVMTHREDMGGA